MNKKSAKYKPYHAKKVIPLSSRIIPCEMDNHKPFSKAVKKAISIIESVHSIDESCDPIPIKLVKECEGYAAQFWYDPLQIVICTNDSPRVLTVVHEIGHYLDYSLGARIDEWRGKLMSEIKRTSGYKTLKNFDPTRMGKVILTDKHGTRERLIPMKEIDPGAKYRIEQCNKCELFARAYEQYIGMKSRQLQSELEPETENRLNLISRENIEVTWNARPILWKTGDFIEVERTFDLFFLDIGWKISTN